MAVPLCRMSGSAITSAEILVHGHVKMIEIAVTCPKNSATATAVLCKEP